MAVKVARNSVLVNLGAINSVTGLDLSIPEASLPEKEVPSSPVQTHPNQSR